MSTTEQSTRGTHYFVSCATSSTPLIYEYIEAAQAAGWDVHVLLTPSARPFVDEERLERLCGHKVWSEFQRPGEPDIWPPADAVIVFTQRLRPLVVSLTCPGRPGSQKPEPTFAIELRSAQVRPVGKGHAL